MGMIENDGGEVKYMVNALMVYATDGGDWVVYEL